MTGIWLLVIVVGVALAFDFTNGFHDTANSMAAPIATGALKPRTAVALSAILNVLGAFISLKVATTIAKGMVDTTSVTLSVLLAALAGAMIWNLLTWYLGLPSSSSHALIGGLLGATIVATGTGAVKWSGFIEKVLVPAVGAVAIAGLVAAFATYLTYRLIPSRRSKTVTRGYRYGQIASSSLMSLAHGTNDAQKTMGIITLALVANGDLPTKGFDVPTWVILASAASIGLGTYLGGWRIIRTLGERVTQIDAPQGFAAQVTAATAILASSFNGYALSTTHVASGAIMGSGVGRRLDGVCWRLVGRMTSAWVITLPAAATVAGLGVGLDRLFRGGYAGAAALTVVLAATSLTIWKLSRKDAVGANDVGKSIDPPAVPIDPPAVPSDPPAVSIARIEIAA